MSEEVVAKTLETIEEEDQLASYAAETINTSNHLNSIVDNNLNSSNSPIMTKLPIPTPPQSPKPSLEHIPSPKHDQHLSMALVISSPQLTHESDSPNIGQMIKDFSQQETGPITSVLEELSSHLIGELPYG